MNNEREIPEHAQTVMYRSEIELLKEATHQASTKDALRVAALDYNERYTKKQKKAASQEIEEMKENE